MFVIVPSPSSLIRASGFPGQGKAEGQGGDCQIDVADWRALTFLRRRAYSYLHESERKAEHHGFWFIPLLLDFIQQSTLPCIKFYLVPTFSSIVFFEASSPLSSAPNEAHKQLFFVGISIVDL